MAKFSRYLNEEKQKEIVFLIGFPGSGKSTYIRNHLKGYVVVSNDAVVEKYAKKWNMSYQDAWEKLDFSVVKKETQDQFRRGVASKKSIVIDNTNLTKNVRIKYPTPPGYKRIAVIMNISEKQRMAQFKKRKEETEKDIPPEAIEKMKKDYEPPSKSEGFDEIRKA